MKLESNSLLHFNSILAGFMPHAYHMESSSKENSSNSGVAKPTSSSSLTNIMERSQHAHHHASTHQRHHNMNRALLSKGSRHYYSIQHSQRYDPNNGGTSTSHGKSTVRDDRHSWKFGHRHESGFGYNAGRRDKASRRLDRIRSNPPVMEFISPQVMNMPCGSCQQKTGDNSVVAVLVCGHTYHADCLETRTCKEDRRDPPCPLCIPSSSVSN